MQPLLCGAGFGLPTRPSRWASTLSPWIFFWLCPNDLPGLECCRVECAARCSAEPDPRTALADEYTYATLFTLGLADGEAGRWDSAIAHFNEAVAYQDNGSLSAVTRDQKHLFDLDLLYSTRSCLRKRRAGSVCRA